MAKKQKKESVKKKFLMIFWGTAAGLFFGVVLLFVLIANGRFGYMPTFDILENPRTNIASEVYSADGVLLTTFFLNENRNPVEYRELPPYLINALIAREDHRFVDHSGIDGIGLIRVLVKTVILRQSGEGGGSTITQQLAKQLFQRDDTQYRWKLMRNAHMATIKFREWVIAVRLEKQYTKQEIVTMYLNVVPFVYDAFGIKSAARTFFQKEVHELTIEESALLMGMLQRPSWFNPVRNPERATDRRNSVLNKMVEHGFLSQAAFDSIRQIPLDMSNFLRLDHHAGIAPYFREYVLRLNMTERAPRRENYTNRQLFTEDSIKWANNPLIGWTHKNRRPDGTPYNLYTDGLKIYTTIDSRMQRYAEEAMQDHMKAHQSLFFDEQRGRRTAPFGADVTEQQINNIMVNAARGTERYRLARTRGMSHADIMRTFNQPAEMTVFSWNGDIDTIMTPMDSIRYYKSYLRAGMMAMNPHTGEVKAYVGGINYRHFKYDAVTVQTRQVGSTFKPFLYTLAFQDRRDLTPCHRVLNQQQTFIVNDSVWAPQSSGRAEFFNQNVTLKWGLAASENNISAWLMKQLSPHAVVEMAQKMGITSPMDAVPALCLGTADLTVAEMTAAFSVYPSGGIYTEPIFVTRIEDKNGNLLQRFTPFREEAISEQTAYLMTSILQEVVRNGTGVRLRSMYNLRNEIGGKTGTTQNHSDGWFIGITPDLVAGVWVGGEERAIRFRAMSLGQGAAMALPIYGMFMQKVYADRSINLTQGPFPIPANFNINLDCYDELLESGIIYQD